MSRIIGVENRLGINLVDLDAADLIVIHLAGLDEGISIVRENTPQTFAIILDVVEKWLSTTGGDD